jgi:hypothetical protein
VTLFKVSGVLKLLAETLAEDEYLLAFTRTFMLHSRDGFEHKVTNELVYWDFPTSECANHAFKVTTVSGIIIL